MSQQEIRLALDDNHPSGGGLSVLVSGLAPIELSRIGKSSFRPLAEPPGMGRVRCEVSDDTSQQLLLAQDLFIDALRERWSAWFQSADSDVLDDAAEPVIALDRRGSRVATLLVEGTWPEDEPEVSARLTRAVFDGTGLAVVWTLRSLRPPPEPEQEPEARSLRRERRRQELAAAIEAAVRTAMDGDSDGD